MICCFTGHRPKGFPFPRKVESLSYKSYLSELKSKINSLIDEGYDHFVCGMAAGADLDFALCVLEAQKSTPHITLEAALPSPYKEGKKATEDTEQNRDTILPLCNYIVTVSDFYFRGCMQKRNRYMVDKCDLVLAVWNGTEDGGTWYTIKYANSKEKKVDVINLKEHIQ